jgi:nicotinamidase/pyrazinamidase
MSTVFFDIDSQMDFLYPAGALYVPGAERVVPGIAKLNRWAAAQGIPVVSTVDAHTEDDPEFKVWPHHCVAGSTGKHKAESTLLERRVVVPNVLREIPLEYSQIILEKQNVDVFTAVNLRPLLDRLGAEQCVVYGVVTEICVWYAALGLLKTGRQVTVVTDAIQTLQAKDSAQALSEIAAAGGRLARAADYHG